MKKCSYCSRENRDEADCCFECGSRFAPAPAAINRGSAAQVIPQAKAGKCSYCGVQNAEEAECCAGCGTQLTATQPTDGDEGIASLLSKSESTLEATASENPWAAKDAWKCFGMFVVFEFVLVEIYKVIGIAFPGIRHFYGTGAGHLATAIIHYAVQILNVLYFARTETLQSFLKAFGLGNPPTRYAWFGAAGALILRSAGHLIASSGLARSTTTTSLWGFAHSTGLQAVLYLAPALIAPFAEEIYMRGFFYRAFRGSYSVSVSTGLIVAITALTHWNQFSRSWLAVVELSALTTLQCFLRERTGNLHDCIICHLVFNASAALLMLRVT